MLGKIIRNISEMNKIRLNRLLNKSRLFNLMFMMAAVYIVLGLTKIGVFLVSTRKLFDSIDYTLKKERDSFHLNRLLHLKKDSLPLSDPASFSSFYIDTPASKAKNTFNDKTRSIGEYVPSKTFQHVYRRMPDIDIQSGENKSLEVLLRRGDIEPATDLVTRDTKVILWYSPTRYHPRLSRLHPLRGCPESRCRVTTNRDFYSQSDALVFTAQLLDQMPPVKLTNQVWILHNHESPRWVNKNTYLYNEAWSSKFNWTMDYRNDADFKVPYGILQSKNGTFLREEHPPIRNYSQIWSSKKGTIAWMVSNCRTMSKRMEYVRELSRYVQVDIFGKCGDHRCPRSDDESCLEHLSKNYKFYLAFENAFCKDYITEKFFRNFNSDMVVVARGGGDYSAVAPPGTFINAADFVSPQRLAQLLNELAHNERDYVNILRKKNQYHAVWEEWPIVKNGIIEYMTYHYDMVPMCDICNRLWDVESNGTLYMDIGDWFDKGMCFEPSDLTSDRL
ncbi:alpha-(1,3)-fucosyltransferase C-like [Haliotis rufescens]|uniref:alpha-(1,3)-fucosyltransferase C-like n=1 Tax=Haliotis rufescens TaxID=6454 RepID=UPI00201F529F|nr:alpha-(1,3)-fucosyltransferase C-like [Haliotis rufescens]